MATPFRRPWVSWRVVSSIGELRGCTISAGSQDAGQAIATIPRSSGDGPVEIQRLAISLSSSPISLYLPKGTLELASTRGRRGMDATARWKKATTKVKLVNAVSRAFASCPHGIDGDTFFTVIPDEVREAVPLMYSMTEGGCSELVDLALTAGLPQWHVLCPIDAMDAPPALGVQKGAVRSQVIRGKRYGKSGCVWCTSVCR